MGLFSRLRVSSLYIFWRTPFGMSRMLLLLRSRTFSFAVAGSFSFINDFDFALSINVKY